MALYVPLAVHSVKRNFVFGKKVESGNILRITNPFRVRLEQKFLSNLKVIVSAGLR